MRHLLDGHPMLDGIIDALHAGQTPREVAAWCDPPVSHMTIWKLQKEHVEPERRFILERIEAFVAEHGHFPVLAPDDDLSDAELEADECLRAVFDYKYKRLMPALKWARRNAALELIQGSGGAK